MTFLPAPLAEELELPTVLHALANPTRLTIVSRLAAGEVMTCSTVLPEIPKSTASHHWRVLREAGVLHASKRGREVVHYLRSDDLEAQFPGLLGTIVAAAAP